MEKSTNRAFVYFGTTPRAVLALLFGRGGLVSGLTFGLVFGLGAGLVAGLGFGLTAGQITMRTIPNERNSTVIAKCTNQPFSRRAGLG